MTRIRIAMALAGLAALVPGAAVAHTGAGATHGFAAGLLHPLLGLDHLLAMVTVGLLAAGLGGRAVWAVPGSFLAMMAAGGLAAMAGVPLPAVETGIALSLVVLGGALALQAPPRTAVAAALAGGFAVFHGHAHGAEMPAEASGLLYAGGFLAATLALHGLGLLLGLGVNRAAAGRARPVARASGLAVSFVGGVLLLGLV